MLNKEPSPERAKLGFKGEVLSSFRFLNDARFRPVEQEMTLVRYESPEAFVTVYHGRASFELGTINEEYVFFNGKRIARLDLPSGTVHYYFADHLGSASVVTDAQGITIEQESDYYPFGGERVLTSGPNTYKFTGKERDSESGLDMFGARYMSSSMGRFMTPDWGGPLDERDPVPWAEYDNPQSLNLYSYTRNNPTTFGDDDGHDCVVQTRTGDKTETVSTTSGNCDNVKVGDGQTKTYVPGTVTGISAGADGKSIDIGYTPYDQNVSAGVMNASSAPYPDRPGLAYGFNESGYRLLGTAGATMNDPRTFALWYGASALGGLSLYAGGVFEGGLTTLGDLTITPTAGEQAYAERLLAQGGQKAVEKAIRTLSKRLAEHEAKVGSLKYPGTVEREISTFTRTIQALKNVLR